MTTEIRDRIRSAVKPFPRKAVYATGWNGEMTFEQIYDNLAHYASNVMKSKGIHRTNYLPDCLQIGFMSLWEELIENNQFLLDKTRQQAVFFVRHFSALSTQVRNKKPPAMRVEKKFL